jgi:hypothetical protein
MYGMNNIKFMKTGIHHSSTPVLYKTNMAYNLVPSEAIAYLSVLLTYYKLVKQKHFYIVS